MNVIGLEIEEFDSFNLWQRCFLTNTSYTFFSYSLLPPLSVAAHVFKKLKRMENLYKMQLKAGKMYFLEKNFLPVIEKKPASLWYCIELQMNSNGFKVKKNWWL